MVRNHKGYACATWSTTLAKSARAAMALQVEVELVTRAPKDPRYAPTLEELISPVPLQVEP